MKRLILILMVVCLLALGGQSFAEMCTIDAVPAATLLLPVFKVAIGDDYTYFDGECLEGGNGIADCVEGCGIDTFFSINNASAAPALAHVTLWTDWSWPSLDFDVFLTGYDMQSVSLCDVIANGNLPVTAGTDVDTADTISPNYEWSDDGYFPDCEGLGWDNPIVTGTRLERVQNAHTGDPISTLGGACAGNGFADDIARGYVTVDNVWRCSIIFPSDSGAGLQQYFNNGVDDGFTIARNANMLWGDYFKVDRANDFAEGDNLVHIEAQDGFDGGSDPPASGYTYYGRYPTAIANALFGGADNREPLGSAWAARYLSDVGPFNASKFSVWRDSTEGGVNPNSGWACGLCEDEAGAGPDWCPLNERQVVCFDEEEDCREICGFAEDVISPPDPLDEKCFPLESNHLTVGHDPLDPGFPYGWCFLNLNVNVADAVPGGFGPDGDLAQSYVSVGHSALGRFSVGYSAIELYSSCSLANPVLTDD